MNKYRKLTIYLIFLGMISILVGVSYSFFNYTRTGSTNNFSVGRISFRSKNEETINLTNLFPIDPSNATDMVDSTKVGTYSIGIEGDTDYHSGLEYLVSVVDSNINLLPINIDISVSSGLGTSNDNYFTARESKNANIYKRLVGNEIVGDQVLLVGYIKPNSVLGTPSGVDGTITITAFLDKNKILVSDTYDGTESDNMGTTNNMAEGKRVLTTNEWNSLSTNGVSFKVKVEANEGIWVTGTLEEIMKKTAVMDNISSTFVSASTGIDFGEVSSDTNGKGVYIRSGTENDEYPIMYYRGDVTDNNVLFANTCWKTVRTTDTGGVKLIYNGPSNKIEYYKNNTIMSDSDITYTNDVTYPYTYDSTTKKWTSGNAGVHNSSSTISFSVKTPGTYSINYMVSCEDFFDGVYFYKNDVFIKKTVSEYTGVLNLENLLSSDVIKIEYHKDKSDSFGQDLVSFEIVKNEDKEYETEDCDDRYTDRLDVNSFFSGDEKYNSPAYVGYMYGTEYLTTSSNWKSGARFGSSFTWDGSNYTLVGDTVTSPDATHHYSCNVTTENGTCSNIRFVVAKYGNNGNVYYITLSGGDDINDALKKMWMNTTDSAIKTAVDSWYASKLIKYTNKIEDTIWCNDRSIENIGAYSPNGPIDDDSFMLFGGYERSNNASISSTTKDHPSLVCKNKNDRFTVNNTSGNGALTYPVALITSDEMVLSGGVYYKVSNTYLDNYYNPYWTMTPFYADDWGYNIMYTKHSGFSVNTLAYYTTSVSSGVRPMISIKPGQLISKGTGTLLDPYVIE